MDHKKVVGKSKSSNIGTAAELTANKKSWSSARFAYNSSKKRGVYVEKKAAVAAEPSRAEPGSSDVPSVPKSLKVERRQDKAFLNRCLSILSQETMATQFPEDEASKPPDNITAATVNKSRDNTVATVDKSSQDFDAVYTSTDNDSPERRPSPRLQPIIPLTTIKQRRPKFRSKALSENYNDLHVIQPKKSASQSIEGTRSRRDSTYRVPKLNLKQIALEPNTFPVEDKLKSVLDKDAKSELSTESRKRKKVQIESTISTEVEVKENPNDDKKSEDDRAKVQTAIYPEHSDRLLIKQDSMKLKTLLQKKDRPHFSLPSGFYDAKSTKNEELRTLISDHNSRNKSLYNLFVDLLETTFSVYNVESKYINPPNPTFEVEENTAHKMKTTTSQSNIGVDKAAAQRQRVLFNDVDEVAEKVVVYDARSNYCNWNPPPAAAKTNSFRNNRYGTPRTSYQKSYGNYSRPLKSQSFWNAQKLNAKTAKSIRSVKSKKEAQHKQDKNSNLLHILKKELRMDDEFYDYEEPGDFHQALAKIAEEKKRTRKLIRFAEDDGKAERSGKYDCFKRRNVISGSTKSPKKKPRKTSFMDTLRESFLPQEYAMHIYENEPSYHSIEVKAYDFEPNQHLRRVDLTNKPLIYTTNSKNSLITVESERKADIGNKLSTLSYLSGRSSKTVSTTISQLLLRDVYNMY